MLPQALNISGMLKKLLHPNKCTKIQQLYDGENGKLR